MNEIERAWAEHRRRVFDVGYRMLGTVTDADDVVGETYLRLTRHGLDAVEDVEAWLVAVAARVSLDRLRRETRRTAYVGPWLPEPIVSTASPEDRVTLDDSVHMALLIVLEHLSPAERTSFLLHDVFGLSFAEVADVVGRSESACRQLAARARRRIASARPSRAAQPHANLEAVARGFATACRTGQLDDLVDVLDPDVIGDFDSGGMIPGAPIAELTGAHAVAGQLIRWLHHPGVGLTVSDVNGEPGVVVTAHDRVVTVIALTCVDGRVTQIHAIGNPNKLAHLTASHS
jgi:RNA polymerase sigma-70 factor (ECF subfamily)